MIDGVLLRPLGNGGIDFGHAAHAAGVVGEVGVLPQVVAPHGVHQALEDGVAVARNQHIAAVLAGVGVGRRNAGQGATGRPTHFAKGAVFGQEAFHAIEHRLIQGHIDHLTLTRTLSLLQRQQDANDTMQSGQGVAQAHPHTHRHAAGLCGQVSNPAHGLAHHTKSGAVAVGAGLAIATHAQHDELGVGRQQVLGGQAPAFEGARPEVLDQHIGLGGELAHQGLGLGLLEVQRDGALVARLHLPPHRGAVLEQSPFAQRVATARGFDLDHIGTKVGQGFGRKRASNQLPHFNDLEAGQGGVFARGLGAHAVMVKLGRVGDCQG